MRREDLIGTWRAAGQIKIAADGSVSHPMGEGPHPGFISYTADGYVIVVATSSKSVPSKPVEALSQAEKAAAADGCVAYCGRYEIDGATIYHHIEVALFPAWVGQKRVRHASLDGTRLTLVGAPNPDGSIDHIYWERTS